MAPKKIRDKASIDFSGRKNFKDLSPLQDFTKMERLDLNRTEITDISELGGLKNIWRLGLQGTRISGFSPLLSLPKLKRIDVGDYLCKKSYRKSVPVSELGLNWQTIEGEENIRYFVQNSE